MMRQSRVRADTTTRGTIHTILPIPGWGVRVTLDKVVLSGKHKPVTQLEFQKKKKMRKGLKPYTANFLSALGTLCRGGEKNDIMGC